MATTRRPIISQRRTRRLGAAGSGSAGASWRRGIIALGLGGDDGLALAKTADDFDVGVGRDAGLDLDVAATAVRANDLDQIAPAELLHGRGRHDEGVVAL